MRGGDMKVKRLYIVNDGVENVDMLITSLLLHPADYEFVRAECNGREVRNLLWGYYNGCLDLVEFKVVARTRDLYDVAYDLYRVDSTERVNMFDMIFVVETEEGEYMEFSITDVRNWMWSDFIEEVAEIWEEDEDEGEEEVTEVRVI
jgi:hypothetical protein